MLEGNVALAGIAARTQKVNVGLMVGGVTYRNPALHAKITTTLDIVSGGRAIHGIGAAWFEEEHRAYGFDFPPLGERFERLEEALQITRAMFTQEQATFEGKHYRVEGAYNNPKPLRGDIPILIGGSGEKKTLRMVAQYGDGSNIFGDADRCRHLIGVLNEHCERLGRNPAEITKTRLGSLAVGKTHEEAERVLSAWPDRASMPEDRRRMFLNIGDPDEIGEQVRALLDSGLDGLLFSLPNVEDPEAVALAGETLTRAFAG
jgi:alkanesulfonate monooxygenase SsuD/methylene tetrahydromethanopterin reductase-like flavin-dependent oxidoreductase (luciferase family)